MTTAFDPIDIALKVTRALDHLGIAHTIGGSIAASFAGEPRASIDVDVVAALDEPRIAAFVSALGEEFYADRDAIQHAVRTTSRANVIHQPTQLKVDISSRARRRWMNTSCGGGCPLTSAMGESSISIRPKTSCCRSFAGSGTAAKSLTVNGGTSSALSGPRDTDWTARIWPNTLRH